MNSQKKSRGTPLVFDINIAPMQTLNIDTYPVHIKNTTPSKKTETQPIETIQGNLSIRTEKKGRNGKPVIILYKFSSPAALNPKNLENLCSILKTKCACGGTIENSEIILLMRNPEQLRQILLNLQINIKK